MNCLSNQAVAGTFTFKCVEHSWSTLPCLGFTEQKRLSRKVSLAVNEVGIWANFRWVQALWSLTSLMWSPRVSIPVSPVGGGFQFLRVPRVSATEGKSCAQSNMAEVCCELPWPIRSGWMPQMSHERSEIFTFQTIYLMLWFL